MVGNISIFSSWRYFVNRKFKSFGKFFSVNSSSRIMAVIMLQAGLDDVECFNATYDKLTIICFFF